MDIQNVFEDIQKCILGYPYMNYRYHKMGFGYP